MDKTEAIFKKVNNQLQPCYPDAYWEMYKQIKEGDFIKCVFSDVKKSKTQPQLAYLYAVAYPFAIKEHIKLNGPDLYHRELMGHKIAVKANVENMDTFFKCLFALHKGEEMPKSKMNVEEMAEYISFIDAFCIENYGYELPEPVRNKWNKTFF